MNRGFRFYFSQAMRSSCKSLWKKGNIFKFIAYYIMSLLSNFIFLSPMFDLAGVRQAKIASKENKIDIPQSFKVACRAKPFFTMYLAIALEALIVVAGLIIIGIISAMLGAVGYAISNFVITVRPELIIGVFLAPGGLIALVYLIVICFLFAPTAYVIETNPDIGAANAVSICINTMKSRGKTTCFLSFFVTYLIEYLILTAGVVIEYVIFAYARIDIRLLILIMVLVGLIFFIAFALIAPMFALARKVTLTSLFEDIVLDPVNASKRVSGVNIRRCKGVKFDPAEYENELCALFDETYTDRIPVPETERARKKRERAERKALKSAPEPIEAPAIPVAEEPAPAPAQPEPASVPRTEDEEDGELLTVSELIRDVEPAEQPAVPEPVVEPAPEPEPVVEPAPEPETEEPEPEPELPAEPEPAQPEEEATVENEEPEETTEQEKDGNSEE